MGDDMELPPGKSCVDCAHYRTCLGLIGPKWINEASTRCDFSPSRFRLPPTPTSNPGEEP